MAYFRRRGKRWQAEVYVEGKRESRTLHTKAEAQQWAAQRELELTGRALPNKTLQDAFTRYAETVSPKKRGARWEIIRLRLLGRSQVASVRLSRLTPSDIANWRDERLQSVSDGTVAREFNLIRSVLEVARKEWGWIQVNPCKDVARPPRPPSRRRRITDNEIERLTYAFGLGEGLVADTTLNRTGLAFLFALETAMRSGEICGITPSDVHPRSVTLPRTKNGDAREVPLSARAREILDVVEGDFRLSDALRDRRFRQARDAAQIEGLTFHDTRAEAIWRLSKKLDVLELARMIGHRNTNSLLYYYNTSAEELAAKL